jgi:threonine dehydrogenase-like Zn-dependent dehydrogenase
LNHPGAYSQYTTWFPKSSFKLPESVSNEEGALIEPMAVGLHAIALTDIRPNDKVLILGGGIIGLGVAELVRGYSAGLVAMTEIVPEKIEGIKKFGCADYVLKGDTEDIFEQYQKVSEGGFDVVFDCAEVAPAINGAIGYAFKPQTRARKCFTSLALTNKPVPVNYSDIVLKEIVWKGSKGHTPAEFQAVLKNVATGNLNVKKYITKRIPFTQVQQGFEEIKAMGGTLGKAIIVME